VLRVRKIAFLSITALVTLAIARAVPAAADPPGGKAVVTVQGMACPFCAYGLEKRLKTLDGVSDVQIDLGKSEATLEFREGSTVSDEEIRQEVRRAGFTPGAIRRARDQVNERD